MCIVVWHHCASLSATFHHTNNDDDDDDDNDDAPTTYCVAQVVLPRLATEARVLLGVPATSTSSERSFSLAGRTLEERRSTLSPTSVDGLLFLHGL